MQRVRINPHFNTPLLAALFAVSLSVAGCKPDVESAGDAKAEGNKRPNVVFVLIDTLRADHVGVCGGTDDLTPVIDQMGTEGAVFQSAIAAAPWTQPSMASLFAAVYPGVHGVTDFDFAMASTYAGTPRVRVFDNRFTTLAEGLKQAGYQTAGFVANPFVLKDFGFAQGFDHYDASFAQNATTGNVVNQAVTSWLNNNERAGEPLFLYVHYMDVHGPYKAWPEVLDPLLREVEAIPPEQRRSLTDEEFAALEYLKSLHPMYRSDNRHQTLSKCWEYWEARYSAGVSQADAYVGELMDTLKEHDLLENTLVVITSDHGEALCEHGFWDHGKSCHHYEMRVPLIFYWPGQIHPANITARTRLIDVTPTILEAAGGAQLTNVQGRTLLGFLWGDERKSRAAFAEANKGAAPQCAIYEGPWKLLLTQQPDESFKPSLFRPADDPLEKNDLAAANPEEVARLTALLDKQRQANADLKGEAGSESVPLDDEQVDRLKDLGYIK